MLPQELDDHILDYFQEDIRILMTCALVCRRWGTHCRHHLYRKVHLKTRIQLGMFYRSLTAAASLRDVVGSVVVHTPMHSLNAGDDHIDLDIALVLLFSILPNLKTLFVDGDISTNPNGTLHIGPTSFRLATSLRMLSKLVLHDLRFVTLAAFGRFVLAFPCLKILNCTDVSAAYHGDQPLVQALVSRRLDILELNISATRRCGYHYDAEILALLLRTSHGHLRHLSISAGSAVEETFRRLNRPMARLPSLEIRFDRGLFSFGRQEVDLIRVIVEKTLPEALQVVFEGCGTLPVLRDGKPRTSAELRRLDALLSSLPELQLVTFVIPHGARARRTFWQTTFQDCFVSLPKRGYLAVTYGRTSLGEEGPEENTLARPLDGRPPGYSVASLAMSLDSKWVASGSSDGLVTLWDPEDSSILGQWTCVQVGIVWYLAFSPDSRRLVCSGNEGHIEVWDVEQAHELGTLEGHTDAVRKVVWSPDGTRFASGSDDMTVRIWHAETYRPLYVLEGHSGIVMSVSFSQDGMLLASCGRDHRCCIWEVDTGVLKHDLSGHTDIVWTAVFDPNTSRIVTASDDRSVRIWSVETGEELVTLREHRGRVWVVAFSEDGEQILSASSDSVVKVSDSFSGERILALEGHSYRVNAAQFSPDGKYIASASADKTVRLWNRSDGSCAATFEEHTDKVTHVVFSPDGRTLVSGGHDGMVCIRRLSDFV